MRFCRLHVSYVLCLVLPITYNDVGYICSDNVLVIRSYDFAINYESLYDVCDIHYCKSQHYQAIECNGWLDVMLSEFAKQFV